MPLPLIDKFDNFELVRNEIAAILAKETINQQELAVLAEKDPDLWRFDVFIERSRPWESLTSSENPVFPVVNVWFDSENFAGNQSFNALLQTAEDGIFNIDIFSVAINKKSAGDGYITADRQAVLNTQRIVRLVRNILFSVPPDNTLPGENYTFLNLKGIVGYRRIQSITTFQPEYDKQAITIAGARVTLAVKYIETSLEGPDQDLDLIQVDIITTDGGQVIFTFDTT